MNKKKLGDLNLMDDFLFQAIIRSFPKRVRFYHAIIDSHVLKSGQEFGKLKNVYVIFLCNYDPFGCDRAKYTIKNMCVEDPDIPYEDGACTIVLYTKGTQGDIPEDLRQFLDYMEHTNADHAITDTLKELQQMVDTVKQDGEVSIAYMNISFYMATCHLKNLCRPCNGQNNVKAQFPGTSRILGFCLKSDITDLSLCFSFILLVNFSPIP